MINLERDFYNNFNSNFTDYGQNIDDPMFNPIMQYEQAFYYYKYLCMQMDYKIKCKEFENLSNNQESKTGRRIE